MKFFALFIRRPVATSLLTLAIVLAGMAAFVLLPVSPLPQVDYPTISVSASQAGASPETMAATVATPLERALGRIAGISEITSSSTLGNTRITLQFELDRDINASRSLLPALPRNPGYRKVNPADAPILVLSLTSSTATRGQMYDMAATVLAQQLLQMQGVGDVGIGGSSLPAVRIELNPEQLASYGISLDAVRTAINNANANRPKGFLETDERRWQIVANDQIERAADYRPLIIRHSEGRLVRLEDVATVSDSVQDIRNAGSANGEPAVLLSIYREPGANVIRTIDGVRALLPHLEAQIPASMQLAVALDRSPMIRASLKEVERALVLSVALVILVVFLFLKNGRASLVPAVVVPVSLIGSFGAMYLCGFSLNNLSLMALTISTGFVVDDAIVVMENIHRHVERGIPPFRAALLGVRQVGFTVLSMSLSLIAVFIPLLAMGSIVGRLFRKFAITLSVAILISLVVSLTTTPMMCARLIRRQPATDSETPRGGWLYRLLFAAYRHSLAWALRHGIWMLILLAATIALNVYLYTIVPKGFFPQQDTGILSGSIQADQSISFQAMQVKLKRFIDIVRADPAVANVIGYTGGSRTNSGSVSIALKPLDERREPAEAVVDRLREKLAHEPGARLYFQAVQDLRIGGRSGGAQYQYTLQADDLDLLLKWEPRVRLAFSNLPQLEDVNTDQQERGSQTSILIDRDAASRLGLSPRLITAALSNAYSQRQIATLYRPLNQYRVVMEVAPRFREGPEALERMVLINAAGERIPFAAFARYSQTFASLAVSHQGEFPASTISFNLKNGVSLSEASAAIDNAMRQIGVPSSVHGSLQGSANAFKKNLAELPLLILAAIVTLYIVLGILYESLIHPLTILSTLPSAGVGALLALIAFIGVLLLIGIVKKNAIMMIDFALEAERREGLAPREAIHKACLLRFRPIMMTTLAAILGAVPLALGSGDGAELRAPLGISIIGGLLLSQLLTLYTTPVVYLYLDRFRLWCHRWRHAAPARPEATGVRP
ncbi:MAG: multidrug transporter subunit MdtC [Candidatus Dactylopiibacterium carminicum]|uniref:Multidrug transporter subunit MdtC n=1 Tax=Candidatus Dactylopiibacterium carminicum TaxID=857335 RepID=A0A272EQT8_9RHOO|nr:efflux RND transporter permease subunit [Candidatus Dactylopiibacterium carminicum]KAF7600718.1 multidrug transporter subunit MdtC [Candidatus Dactylopiibacterium carminicum]PAS92477.1 MAG: multidrug transporter subunit MdtC [Candidatus Dactylopiibacterium carminicum]PAS96047.1 MAG: multidrug transporter subunit MdtC [Candidatus Dactylopiibacterium carminicum]PAT00723.1 MAG: multidrug transporter subunit MdtC [Candidatus Dactylopiibacterium carminicum]